MSHVPYMQRIHDYYLEQGYEKPYQWAHFDSAPFSPLPKPLSECRVTLISTSDVSLRNSVDEGLSAKEKTIGDVYSIPWTTPLEHLHSRQESYDKQATHLDDINAFLPLTRLQELTKAGRIGGVTENFHNVNRGYSQRLMMETAAPAVLASIRGEGADVAILTPV